VKFVKNFKGGTSCRSLDTSPLPSVSRPAVRPTQFPVQRVPRPDRDIDHSSLSSAEVKNE
jgi:hypothetical protein